MSDFIVVIRTLLLKVPAQQPLSTNRIGHERDSTWWTTIFLLSMLKDV